MTLQRAKPSTLLRELLNNLEKSIPSGDDIDDIKKITEISKEVMSTEKRFPTLLFAVSASDGISVAGGDIPDTAEEREKLFTGIGRSLADTDRDVRFMVFVSQAEMRIKSVSDKVFQSIKDNNKMIMTDEQEAQLDSLCGKGNFFSAMSLIVHAKKISGETYVNAHPYFEDQFGNISWIEMPEEVKDFSSTSWKKTKPGDKASYSRNEMLENIYTGYCFKKFYKNLV